MHILAIETSCDESATAIVEDGKKILSNVIGSVSDAFAKSGGVIPEEAARKHVKMMLPVLRRAMDEAKVTWSAIDAIAVTRGPGLLGSLLVGATTARTLASIHKKPLIGVHHTLGHLSSTFLSLADGDEPQFPILSLTVSGGHTELWLRESHTRGALLGTTRDDAAGEAFDKGAVLLGLPYPGGPSIAKAAAQGKVDAFTFPSPLKNDPSLDFSFSGLKTSLRYLLRDLENEGKDIHDSALIRDVAASYEHAICAHLVHRLMKALEQHPEVCEVHITGGVSRNEHLRSMAMMNVRHAERSRSMTKSTDSSSAPPRLRWPMDSLLCTDNAAMIAAAAFFMIEELGQEAYKPFITNSSTVSELPFSRQ